MTLVPLWMQELEEALFFPNFKDCFSKWGEYFELAVPAALMICFEWWALEILILFSGLLGVDELDANVILMSVSQF